MSGRRAQLRIVETGAAAPVLTGVRPDRGYLAVYRPGEQNRCPSCGGQNWMVGRTTAECGFCELPIAIAPNGSAKGPLS